MIENTIANQDWVRNLTFLPDEIETLLYKVLIGPFFYYRVHKSDNHDKTEI